MAKILDPNEVFFTSFEPVMSNRFIMYVEGIPAYLIKAANRPSITFGDVTLDHINIDRKLKGKGRWNDVDITLYDAIVPSTSQAVMEWIRTSHESVTGRDGYAAFYKKDLTFNVLGPVGDVVEEWILKGAFIGSTNFGEFDWANGEDAVNIQCTLKYDYAILQY